EFVRDVVMRPAALTTFGRQPRMKRWLLIALLSGLATVALTAQHLGTPMIHAQGSATYPPGWNLVAGPQGSHVRGATGSLYTLLPGDSDYEAFPVTSALLD